MRPEWLISRTASGRASTGQGAMAGDLLRDERRHRDAADRDLAAEAAARPGREQRRLESLPGDQVERAGRRQGEERLAAIEPGMARSP